MNLLRRLLHRHRWETLAVTLGQYAIGPGDITVILSRCRCGEHRTEQVNGHWPRELFMPPTSTTKGD